MDRKVLILEDEKEVAQLYAKCLNTKGYVTEVAHDGIEGLKKLESFTPHLILMDVNMPRMGGLEFYQHICDEYQNPKYPVLVLTARAELETLFRDFQASGFLIKPFASSRLLNEVDIVFDKHHGPKIKGGVKRVVIVEDIQESARKITEVFTKAGYKTDVIDSGIAAIEEMMNNPPDLTVVKLGLIDLTGDKVISRLKQLARTRKVNTLLYIPKCTENDKLELEKISEFRGIKNRLEYNNPAELLHAANEIFQEIQETCSNLN